MNPFFTWKNLSISIYPLKTKLRNFIKNFRKFPAEYHIICSFINHLIENNLFTDAINQLELFYDNYKQHQPFIKETLLSKILKLNSSHQLLFYITLIMLFALKNDIIQTMGRSLLFTLNEIPFQLISRLNTAISQKTIEVDYFEYQCAKLYYLNNNLETALELLRINSSFF